MEAQLDNWVWYLNVWNKVIEKAINIEVKASLQLPFKIREIDSRYLRNYRPSIKKNKDDANREYRNRNKDKHKAKSHNISPTNSQPQTQASKKDKCYGNRQDHPAAEINPTEVSKKNKKKNKAKDLSYFKYYTCK